MDRTLDVRTPESISFSYELAGVGSRFLAVTLDLLIQFAVVLILVLGLAWAGAHAPAKPAHLSGAEKTGFNIVAGLLIVILFAIFFGYFILFEWLWNGQTPGKKALGLRVVRDGGYPIDFGASLVRNLIRVGEMLLGYYALSAVIAILSPENKRLGDMAAGTIVVREARMESPASLLHDMREEPVYASTAYMSGEERALVKRFLERRDTFAAQRRAQLAHQIAERVRPRLPADLQRLDDESLLERL
ncbi:MAG TPA: RDD family protein [Candidatus Aquilonibacter sp.]|nr:RDD family protein [Candidatus Aquilonibacter sp.]